MENYFRAKLQKITPSKINRVSYRALFKDFKDPLSTDGNLKVSGRWHKKGEFRALYASETKEVCVEELKRKVEDDEVIKLFDIHKLTVKADKLLDLSREENLKILGVTEEELLSGSIENPKEIKLPNELAKCAFEMGFEGIIVKSASRAGNNIIIFTENLGKTSYVKILNR